MNHIIISRVNLHMKLDPYKYKVTELWNQPGWNESRIQLLNDWARTSLRGQCNQNFTFVSLWQSGFMAQGGELDNEIKIEIENTGTIDDEPLDYDALINNKVGKKTLNFADQIRDKIRSRFKAPILVTSLDCDDALQWDYVDVMQRQKWHTQMYYDVEARYSYNLETGQKGIKRTKTPSPFTTCYEEKIQCFPARLNHTYLGEHIKGEKIKGLFALQTVNKSNMFSRKVGDEVNFNLEDFI